MDSNFESNSNEKIHEVSETEFDSEQLSDSGDVDVDFDDCYLDEVRSGEVNDLDDRDFDENDLNFDDCYLDEVRSGEVNDLDDRDFDENDLNFDDCYLDEDPGEENNDANGQDFGKKDLDFDDNSKEHKAEQTNELSYQQTDVAATGEVNPTTHESSFVDKMKDVVFGKDSAYDAERFEKAGIKGAFNEVPRNRREAVYEAFENSPDEIKRTVNELSERLSVENTSGNDCCHYDLEEKKIRMEECLDDAEYAEIFSHEYGHFVDNQKGDVSDTYEFRSAMFEDLSNYDKSTAIGRRNFDEMMNDLMNSDAAFDRAVSDNMSAFFRNDPEIVRRYLYEGVAYYQHDNRYWDWRGNREAEVYANCFSMSAQNNQASCRFMQRYFPRTWERFKKTF